MTTITVSNFELFETYSIKTPTYICKKQNNNFIPNSNDENFDWFLRNLQDIGLHEKLDIEHLLSKMKLEDLPLKLMRSHWFWIYLLIIILFALLTFIDFINTI